MPASLTFEEHLAALEAAGDRLVAVAVDAGLDARVPTCPTWDVRSLLAHQTMVHRWATAHICGDDPDRVPDEIEIAGRVLDLPAYYREGHRALTDALRRAPAGLTAMTFLNDAPPPREFWARRQAHETTVHMVDGLAAVLGRVPAVDETGIATALAVDGLDELLRGFFTLGRCGLYDGDEYRIAVEADDVDIRWVLHIGIQLTVAPDDDPSDTEAAATIRGTAAQLYLGLWNRGDEVQLDGRPDVLDRWRTTQRVRWN